MEDGRIVRVEERRSIASLIRHYTFYLTKQQARHIGRMLPHIIVWSIAFSAGALWRGLLWCSNVYFYTFGIVAVLLYLLEDLGFIGIEIMAPIGFWITWAYFGWIVKMFRHYSKDEPGMFLKGMSLAVVVFILNNLVMIFTPSLYYKFFVAS